MRRVSFAAWLLLAATACQNTEVDPAIAAREQDQILRPFESKRDVLADQLEIEMTANFYSEFVKRVEPAFHIEKREDGAEGGSVYRFVHQRPNSIAALDHPMLFMIRQTTFRVLKRATLTVLGGTADFTLNAIASGQVAIVSAAGSSEVEEFRIENGAFRAR